MEEMRNLSVFILGTTAVGKTKLSLQLCKHLNGEIVSCDSKQLYKHANLMTAKSTPQQLKTFRHNMVDCLQLEQSSYNRNKFYEEVKIHTRRIWKDGKTPIFIGGTNYYMEPILYNVEDLGKLSSEQHLDNSIKEQKQAQNKEQKDLQWIKSLTKQQKCQKLKQLDPLMAQKLHKNDQTRITSFLQRCYKHNKPPSQNYKPYTSELNNQNTVLFWVRNSDKLEHKVVVQSRIKEMLGKQGILQILSVFAYLDIHYFYKQYQQLANSSLEKLEEFKAYLKKKLTAAGIGQSIGYKEFFELYFQFRKTLLNEHTQKQSFKKIVSLYQKKQVNYEMIYSVFQKSYDQIHEHFLNARMLDQAQDQLIRDTWAYCKRQITWIRNRIFLKDPLLVKRFYILDLAKKQRKNSQSDDENQNLQETKKTFDKKDLMERFQTKVRSKAVQIIDEIQTNGFDKAYEKFQHHQDQFREVKQQLKLENWKKFTCKECQIELNGHTEWDQHLKSKRHQKRVKYLQKKDEIDKWIQSRKKRQAQAKARQQQTQDKN